MPAKFLGSKACYKMEELARTEPISVFQQVTLQYICPSRRQTTSWDSGGEGKNGHQMEMVSAGRKGVAGSSHPWLPTETRIQGRTLQDCNLWGHGRAQGAKKTEKSEQLGSYQSK